MEPSHPSGSRARFPTTRSTLVDALRSADPALRKAAIEALIESYWRPTYGYLRAWRGRSREDAEDLVQAFFTHELEREFLADFDSNIARFRTFLRLCLDRFVARVDRARAAHKRGGGLAVRSFDFEDAENSLALQPVTGAVGGAANEIEVYFTREWRRHLFQSALARLRSECESAGRSRRFEILAAIDLHPGDRVPTYAEAAARFAVPVTTFNNELAAARRELRGIVLDLLRHQCLDENDFQEQLRELLGADS